MHTTFVVSIALYLDAAFSLILRPPEPVLAPVTLHSLELSLDAYIPLPGSPRGINIRWLTWGALRFPSPTRSRRITWPPRFPNPVTSPTFAGRPTRHFPTIRHS